MKERREYPRKNRYTEVSCIVDEIKFSGKMRNVSARGTLIEIIQEPDILLDNAVLGSEIIIIPQEGSWENELKGRIIRLQECEDGLFIAVLFI